MTNSERDKLIKEVVMRTMGDNPDFSKSLANNVQVQQQLQKQQGQVAIINTINRILSGSVTGWELATIVLMVLKLCALADISWFVVFIPFAIPYVIAGIMSLVMWRIQKKKEKN